MLPSQAPAAKEITWLAQLSQLGQLPLGWQSWLEEEGSLTLRLKHQAKQSFSVNLLLEEPPLPCHNELDLLGISHQECWVRQVYLEVDNQPWVFARSIMPLANLSPTARQLIQVGNQPLGHLLFANPQVKRGPLVFCQPNQLNLPSLWGRASCFSSPTGKILVTEHFLHPMASQLMLPLE